VSEILLVSPYFYPHVGGVENHVRYLARNLSKRGLNVTVITTLLDGLKEDEDFEGYHIHRIKPLMTLLRTPITPGIKGYIRKRKENKSEKIIVQAHSPPPLPAYYAARATDDLILTYHCDEDLPTPIGSLIVWLYRSIFGRYTVKKAKRIITSTSSYAKTSRLLWNRKVDIVPMAVDINFFKPADPSQLRNELVSKGVIESGDRVVLFVGRLVQHKGLEEIIACANYVNAKFLICGDGPLKNRLEREIEAQELKDKVKLLGSIDDELLPYYYSLCNVFVLPSHSRLEAFGIVLLEAMACGKPIIASDIPGSREIVVEGYNGLLAEPLNAMDLVEKINTILQNEKNAKEMGKNGRRLAEEKYSWDKITDEIIRVYSETFGELH
jgi:N-acetyllactosaminide 3-alpha-galactosyltransferase